MDEHMTAQELVEITVVTVFLCKKMGELTALPAIKRCVDEIVLCWCKAQDPRHDEYFGILQALKTVDPQAGQERIHG